MKKIVLTFVAVNLVFITLLATTLFLAETYPLQPGDSLYPLQHASEQARLRLSSPGSTRQVDFALALAERRLASLAMVSEDKSVSIAASAFDQALNEAIQSIAASAPGAQGAYYRRMDTMLHQAELVLTGLDAYQDIPAVAAVSEKVLTLLSSQSKEEYEEVLPQQKPGLPRIAATVISFLGRDINHDIFPLAGGHATPDCLTCHDDGKYAGTPADCSTCHPIPVQPDPLVVSGPTLPHETTLYPNHFEGACSDCHGIDSWQPYQFDHAGVVECASCHAADMPNLAFQQESFYAFISFKPQRMPVANGPEIHYPGDCILCHSDSNNWQVASFDHAEVEECLSCHANEIPTAHYTDDCTFCHQDAQDWKTLDVSHDQLSRDCLDCHSQEIPPVHYPGRCSSCHTTDAWQPAVYDHASNLDCNQCHISPERHYHDDCLACHTVLAWEDVVFNHRGYTNCVSCHAPPDAHFDGRCTNCHTTRAWDAFTFAHIGVSDCASCHSSEAPNNHYLMECTTCHSIEGWEDLQYDHADGGECTTCHTAPVYHYEDPCASCHNTTNWQEVGFDHTNYTDCLICHAPPEGHYIGQCSNCHTTSDWADTGFDHTGLTDCWSCHTAEDGHFPGQCSNCHITQNWTEINFDHSGYDNCTGCHIAPTGHWPGQCSSCHGTANWYEVTFNHDGYTNCKSCHTRPDGHPLGQCSKCHTTDTWDIPTPTPTETATDTPTLAKPVSTPTPTPEPEQVATPTPQPPVVVKELPAAPTRQVPAITPVVLP
ncbi:MAG: hypothetical protein L0Z70_14850 [Chloroflexi bacterium]|nr:hypothetical protein [Chloroflexota bacterium]